MCVQPSGIKSSFLDKQNLVHLLFKRKKKKKKFQKNEKSKPNRKKDHK